MSGGLTSPLFYMDTLFVHTASLLSSPCVYRARLSRTEKFPSLSVFYFSVRGEQSPLASEFIFFRTQSRAFIALSPLFEFVFIVTFSPRVDCFALDTPDTGPTYLGSHPPED